MTMAEQLPYRRIITVGAHKASCIKVVEAARALSRCRCELAR